MYVYELQKCHKTTSELTVAHAAVGSQRVAGTTRADGTTVPVAAASSGIQPGAIAVTDWVRVLGNHDAIPDRAILYMVTNTKPRRQV